MYESGCEGRLRSVSGDDEIMSVSSVGRTPPLRPAGAAGAALAHESGFIVATDSPAAAAEGSASAGRTGMAAPVGASLMLALQETMASEGGDREARQHGQKLLAALAELQRALLADGGGDALRRLLLLSEVVPRAGDPELARAINSIRLRARIELARASFAADGTPRSPV